MVGFTKKKLKSKTLGEKLRYVREKSGVNLAEIAKATRIRLEYLEKIEADKFDKLPPEVYVRGFLKGYANYLHIDPEEVIKQYEKERGIQDNLKKHYAPGQKKSSFKFPSITLTPRTFSVVFFLFALAGGFFYFYKEIDKFAENPRLVVIQPLADTSVNGSSIEIIGVTDKDGKITINDQPVYVNEKGEFKENVGLQKGLNKIIVKAENKFEKTSQEEFNISADYELKVAGEEIQKETAEEIRPEKVNIEITVQESPVWIAVKIDDDKTQSGTMLPDSVQRYEGNEKILVTSGKANKTFIKFNGNDIGVLDESPGVVRNVEFNKENPSPIKTEPQPEDPSGENE